MLFNSIDFAIFLPAVFLLYWFVFHRDCRRQNLFLVAASYVFYGWWSWKFLGLIAATSLFSWLSGAGILSIRARGFAPEKERRLTVAVAALSIAINLGILGFFKYYNFFAQSFADAFALFGRRMDVRSLKIILPVGISFYTFQALGYTIDVVRKKIEPAKDIVSFFAFVSFFPQLLAGPIERASNFLAQMQRPRTFDYAKSVDGLRQTLWGLFKKIAVADTCAIVANSAFANCETAHASQLLAGVVFFAFQIYGDFSGYSDIAVGCSKLFGFNLMQNFNYPYFSRDIAEFWRRWHISLSTWFRDYLYIPLGGSSVGKAKQIRNTLVIFLVSGFWHGANWTFVVWGAYHALLFLPLVLLKKNRRHTNTIAERRLFPSAGEALQAVATFLLVSVGWVFFRAETIGIAFDYLRNMISLEALHAAAGIFQHGAIWTCLFMLLVEWIGRTDKHALEKFGLGWRRVFRIAFYSMLVLCLLHFAKPEGQHEFIYFQF
jgi:Predicted membrane protein involved in D-alanine export